MHNSRVIEFYVLDILVMIDILKRHTATLKDVQVFVASESLTGTVLWHLQIIGEAMNQILKSKKLAHLVKPEWRRIVDLRNIMVHAYFGISEKEILSIIETKIPILEQEMFELVRVLSSDGDWKVAFDDRVQELKDKGRVQSVAYLEWMRQSINWS